MSDEQERKKEMSAFIGYYENATDELPAYDPGHGSPCIVCTRGLTPDDVKTISLMLLHGSRSLFFRVHRTCWDTLDAEEQGQIEGAIIDAEMERNLCVPDNTRL